MGKLKRWNTTSSISPFNSTFTEGAWVAGDGDGGSDAGSEDTIRPSRIPDGPDGVGRRPGQPATRSRAQTAPQSPTTKGGLSRPGWQSAVKVQLQSQPSLYQNPVGRART